MEVQGRRIHLTGSAAVDAPNSLLGIAHDSVRDLVRQLIDSGAGLVVGAGGEPIGDGGLPCIFDWTVLDVIAQAPDPAPNWPVHQPGRFRVVASQAALERIPDDRRETWDKCRRRSDFELSTPPAGWRMGGVIREEQARLGHILVALGGGSGTEHLADLYIEDGKPVVPIRCELGAITNDGNGGSSYLHARALNDHVPFFQMLDGRGGAASRLTSLELTEHTTPSTLSADVVDLLRDLRSPHAFYVRLLDNASPSFAAVEQFFRNVVDPVIAEMGFTRHEVGLDNPTDAFINVEIFRGLHRAGAVIVDLTDVRPNCLMELGYALGRQRHVIISAAKGTKLPFDQDKLPTYFWDSTQTNDTLVSAYREWFQRNFDMPPVV